MTQIEFLTDTIKASQYGDPIYTKVLSSKILAKCGLDQKKADTATAVSNAAFDYFRFLMLLRLIQKIEKYKMAFVKLLSLANNYYNKNVVLHRCDVLKKAASFEAALSD